MQKLIGKLKTESYGITSCLSPAEKIDAA